MSFFSKLFGKKNPLDISLSELNESRIKLESQIQKVKNEIAGIDREIALLFEQAKKAKSKSEESTIATKIKTLNKRKQDLQKIHMQLNKQLMLICNLAIIKENEALLKGTPTWNLLKSMSPEELEEHLVNMQLDVQNFNESLNKMLGMMDQMIEAGVDFEGDKELAEIMRAIHAVKEGESEPEAIAKLRSILSDISNNAELVRFNLIEFLRKELGLPKDNAEDLLYIIEDVLNDWARTRGAKKINSQTLNLLTIELLIRLIMPYLKTKSIPPENEIKNQLEQVREQRQELCYFIGYFTDKPGYCEYLSRYRHVAQLLSPTQRACVENILKTAKHVIKESTKIAKMDFHLRVKLWNEIQEKYVLYEKGVCGQFPRNIVEYLDDYIRIHIETALAILALTFKENGEEYPPATGRFNDLELYMLKLIPEYSILDKLEPEEIIGRVLASDEHIKTLLRLYPTMEKSIFSLCSNQYLFWYLMCSWEKQKERLDEKVSKILNHLFGHNLTEDLISQSNSNQRVLAMPVSIWRLNSPSSRRLHLRNIFESIFLHCRGTKKLLGRISKRLSSIGRILAMSPAFTLSIGWGFLKHLDEKPMSINQDGELYIEAEIIHEELEELLDTGGGNVLGSF